MNKTTGKMLCALSLAFAQMLSTGGTVYGQAQASATKPGSKYPFVFKRGDTVLALGGKTRQEYFAAKNPIFLNNNLPDDFSFFRHITDLFIDVTWGTEKYGHPAIEAFMDIRQRMLWGAAGRYIQTDPETVKISDSVVGAHNHRISRPLLWIRDLWLQASLNAIFNFHGKTEHYIKGGLFPFWLGRGIALGPYYGLTKSFLGIGSYHNDQSAPAILISGEIVRDVVSYDLYYTKFEDKSNTLGDTFNHVKANHIGRELNPWRGTSKDNELWAARIKWNAFDDQDGRLDLEPYIFYNEASDLNVESVADAKSMLGTVGLALEWSYSNFEFGGEIAFNYGHQILRCIDRNRIKIVRDPSSGCLKEVYTKVSYGGQDQATVTENLKGLVEANLPTACQCDDLDMFNGKEFGADRSGGFTNASDRFRPERRVDYRGWMFTFDMAYFLEEYNTKFATGYAYASGDTDPNSSSLDSCPIVKYNGFVGINENYAGTRIPSLMVLDARKLARPLTVDNETTFSISDNSFTDMHIVGAGLTWTPMKNDPTKMSINPNVLAFWKAHRTRRFNFCEQVFTNACASRFLGTEFNVFFNYEMLRDLQLYAKFAVFFPGTFYSHSRGVLLASAAFLGLDRRDSTGFDSPNYGLDRDTAYYANIGAEYKF